MVADSFFFNLAAGGSAIDVLALHGPGDAQKIASVDISRPARAAGLTIREWRETWSDAGCDVLTERFSALRFFCRPEQPARHDAFHPAVRDVRLHSG